VSNASVSDYDITHRFVFSTVYDVPFGKTQNRTLHAIAAGWQLTGILTLQTGPAVYGFFGPRCESNTGGGATQDRRTLSATPTFQGQAPTGGSTRALCSRMVPSEIGLPGDTPALADQCAQHIRQCRAEYPAE